MRKALAGIVAILTASCATSDTIASHDLRATETRCCDADSAAEYVGGWYVRKVENGLSPSGSTIFFCDGQGKCLRAKSVVPFQSAQLAGPAQGRRAWIIGTVASGAPEAVFLCDATSTPPVCTLQAEWAQSKAPAPTAAPPTPVPVPVPPTPQAAPVRKPLDPAAGKAACEHLLKATRVRTWGACGMLSPSGAELSVPAMAVLELETLSDDGTATVTASNGVRGAMDCSCLERIGSSP